MLSDSFYQQLKSLSKTSNLILWILKNQTGTSTVLK